MSTLEYNTLVSAGGDGLKRGVEKPPFKRTPVASSRKLTTRPQIRNDNVKLKLENALHELSTPKTRQFNRKRAQTMAEITPSKKKLQGESSNRSWRVASSVGRPVPRKEDASRCVYQQLLLNAWRRRRLQVATLTDSSKQLQTQVCYNLLIIVNQLQIQVDVLQKLRESESQRRSMSASESERLRHEKEELRNTVEKLIKVSICDMYRCGQYNLGCDLTFQNLVNQALLQSTLLWIST
ncbi:hypothetical protein MML48_4g00015354 [Holotrichia oblita]|uniref:Uncharacterized protein n=1 Tax=Holotrichia oblita TaxID=644536 RepID=A0ACB9T9Z0_HOLOL|nr:hypothetical protein MML48_4g00015354 [Holotrichia oblita]